MAIQNRLNDLGGMGMGPAPDALRPPQYGPSTQAPPLPMQPMPAQPLQYQLAQPGQASQSSDGMPPTMIGSYLVAGGAGVLTLALVIVLFSRRK